MSYSRVGLYLEDQDCFTHHMIGFRPVLSTQDTMLLLKHQNIDAGATWGTRAILGLDLEKSFDNIEHSAILNAIPELGFWRRFYEFVRSFVTRRNAMLRAAETSRRKKTSSDSMAPSLPPQGFVLSPTLFNLVMIGLSERLSKIQGLNHTVYADDITIWCS
ncbi:uncharacterized protein LOC142574831 [Dermacentor variabilis]|uniref:uncharacterized protein LOC142574831 n=1 Tax=Dermacentor variabilis TaxID=34621 RepID=UPI003F5B0AB3